MQLNVVFSNDPAVHFSNTKPMPHPHLICPKCASRNMGQPTSVFVEYGEFDRSTYEEEGNADVYRCVECGFQFADLDVFNLDTVPQPEGEVPRAA